MKIEAILFDLDNTLINRKVAFSKYAELFSERFILYTDDKHKKEIKEFMQEADLDGYRKRHELFEEITSNLEMRNPEISIESILEHWVSEFFKCTVLMDGAIEVLQ